MRRRTFLQGTTAAAGLSILGATGGTFGQEKRSANDRVTVCVMGVRGRGGGLLNTFASLEDVDVKYVCDLDQGILESRVKSST